MFNSSMQLVSALFPTPQAGPEGTPDLTDGEAFIVDAGEELIAAENAPLTVPLPENTALNAMLGFVHLPETPQRSSQKQPVNEEVGITRPSEQGTTTTDTAAPSFSTAINEGDADAIDVEAWPSPSEGQPKGESPNHDTRTPLPETERSRVFPQKTFETEADILTASPLTHSEAQSSDAPLHLDGAGVPLTAGSRPLPGTPPELIAHSAPQTISPAMTADLMGSEELPNAQEAVREHVVSQSQMTSRPGATLVGSHSVPELIEKEGEGTRQVSAADRRNDTRISLIDQQGETTPSAKQVAPPSAATPDRPILTNLAADKMPSAPQTALPDLTQTQAIAEPQPYVARVHISAAMPMPSVLHIAPATRIPGAEPALPADRNGDLNVLAGPADLRTGMAAEGQDLPPLQGRKRPALPSGQIQAPAPPLVAYAMFDNVTSNDAVLTASPPLHLDPQMAPAPARPSGQEVTAQTIGAPWPIVARDGPQPRVTEGAQRETSEAPRDGSVSPSSHEPAGLATPVEGKADFAANGINFPVSPVDAKAQADLALSDLQKPTRPLDQPTPVRQLAEAVIASPPEKQTRIEVMLAPETLGRVHFDMRQDAGSLSITLSAERPETLDLMRRHLPDLVAELRQAGIQTGTFSFGSWGEGRQMPAATTNPEGHLGGAPPPPSQHIPPPPRQIMAAGTLNIRL